MWHLVLSELQGHVTMSKKLKHKKSCLRQCSRNVTNTTARTRMSCCLNVSSDDCEVSVVGRLFHTCAAATGKARSPRKRCGDESSGPVALPTILSAAFAAPLLWPENVYFRRHFPNVDRSGWKLTGTEGSIVARNTLVGSIWPRSVHGRLQDKC